MVALTLIFGFAFGALLQYARLNKYDTISGMALLTDFTVAKAIAAAVGIGAILINLEIAMGWAGYHAKPFLSGGIMLGGLVFGAGMAILGYCPGTAVISAGEGSLDAILGIVGGLVAGLVFTLLLPQMGGLLGPDLGVVTLHSLTGHSNALFYPLLLVAGLAFVAIAYALPNKYGKTNFRWLAVGAGLAVLNLLIFSSSIFDRQLGASTAYPFVADVLSGLKENTYFTKIQPSGRWEVWFLLGAMLSGLVLSLLRKDFKFTLIHSNWAKYKGNAVPARVFWSLAGGFLLLFGARMAGGCTSGHIISGGMQLAVSSLTFGAFVFAGLLVTGKLFYRPGKA